MDFNDTPEQAKFRIKCREWLEGNAEIKKNVASSHTETSLEEHLKVSKEWQKKKYDALAKGIRWCGSLPNRKNYLGARRSKI